MTRWRTIAVESRDGVAQVTLNRPDRRNAVDADLAGELREAFEAFGRQPEIRCLVLAAAGPAFCAGVDLRWMSPASPVSNVQAQADAERLAALFRGIDECACPVVARVQGPAFGGGVGLMAACDIVVAAEEATFALSEARLGLVPAIIAPLLLRRAGEAFCRRYCLTGESFPASVAQRAGLVHDLVPADGLDKRIAELIEAIRQLAPGATRASKALIRTLVTLPDAERATAASQANVRARLSAEAGEGLRAFLEKRPPAWTRERRS